MDWLLWLYPPEEAIMRIVEDSEYVRKLLDIKTIEQLND